MERYKYTGQKKKLDGRSNDIWGIIKKQKQNKKKTGDSVLRQKTFGCVDANCAAKIQTSFSRLEIRA